MRIKNAFQELINSKMADAKVSNYFMRNYLISFAFNKGLFWNSSYRVIIGQAFTSLAALFIFSVSRITRFLTGVIRTRWNWNQF